MRLHFYLSGLIGIWGWKWLILGWLVRSMSRITTARAARGSSPSNGCRQKVWPTEWATRKRMWYVSSIVPLDVSVYSGSGGVLISLLKLHVLGESLIREVSGVSLERGSTVHEKLIILWPFNALRVRGFTAMCSSPYLHSIFSLPPLPIFQLVVVWGDMLGGFQSWHGSSLSYHWQ